jgi:hypothetical protein
VPIEHRRSEDRIDARARRTRRVDPRQDRLQL